MELHTCRNAGPPRKSECKPNRARMAVKKGPGTIRRASPCGRTQERGSTQGRVGRVCSRWSSFWSKPEQSTCHGSVTQISGRSSWLTRGSLRQERQATTKALKADWVRRARVLHRFVELEFETSRAGCSTSGCSNPGPSLTSFSAKAVGASAI